MIERLRIHWNAFFFAATAPLNLGICRALFYAVVLSWCGSIDYALWGTLSDVFWMPKAMCVQRLLPVFSPTTLAVMQSFWMASLVLSCVGLWTRWSTLVAFVLGFYLIGLPGAFGWITHRDPLLVITAGILMCSRCGDAFSIDAWRHRRFTGARGTACSAEYTWPVRLVWVLFSLVFFAAGYAKLRHSGLAWIFSDNFARRLALAPHAYPPASLLQPDWCRYVAQHPLLCQFLAGMTVALELGYPLALISWRLRWLIVPSMLAAQVGIIFLLGPNFLPFMLCNLFWVPWDRVVTRLRREQPASETEAASEIAAPLRHAA